MVALLLAGGGFVVGGASGGVSTAETVPTNAPGAGDGERCSPWTDAGQNVELEACIRVKASRMLIRVRMRGPVGTRSEYAARAKWRKTGEPRFGHEVLSPAMRW
ncbi:hypothetical protein [Nonomuraea longicatena]|uniref:Secreted protein n=1 Tax=Nonomuraea longicatena TaxID=83682 RepID=A0ABP3ZH77_9ACTN